MLVPFCHWFCALRISHCLQRLSTVVDSSGSGSSHSLYLKDLEIELDGLENTVAVLSPGPESLFLTALPDKAFIFQNPNFGHV